MADTTLSVEQATRLHRHGLLQRDRLSPELVDRYGQLIDYHVGELSPILDRTQQGARDIHGSTALTNTGKVKALRTLADSAHTAIEGAMADRRRLPDSHIKQAGGPPPPPDEKLWAKQRGLSDTAAHLQMRELRGRLNAMDAVEQRQALLTAARDGDDTLIAAARGHHALISPVRRADLEDADALWQRTHTPSEIKDALNCIQFLQGNSNAAHTRVAELCGLRKDDAAGRTAAKVWDTWEGPPPVVVTSAGSGGQR